MRKKVEAGAHDVVSRVRTVKAAEYVPRSSAHRALIGGGWEGPKQARLQAQQKRLAAGPSAVELDPGKLRPLTIPLLVTRYRSTVRPWPVLEQLLEQVNEFFLPAKVRFELTEPAECNRSVSFARRCPFEEDIDHEFEWLHLALVPRLPGDAPVLAQCGRCLLASDRSDAQSIAQSLSKLLGLQAGVELPTPDIQWLRWQAWLHQGQPVPLPLAVFPVWVYSVVTPSERHSQRTFDEFRELLEEANLIWQQAGVVWDFTTWTEVHEEQVGDSFWRAALSAEEGDLGALTTTLAPEAVHLCLLREPGVDWFCLSRPRPGPLLVREEFFHQEMPARHLAHALGKCLGLAPVVGPDQLMCPFSLGTRISPQEAALVRAQQPNLDLLPGQLANRAVAELPQSSLPPLSLSVKIHLVRGARRAARTSLMDMQFRLDRVSRIWRQASISLDFNLVEVTLTDEVLEAAYPNPPGAAPQGRRPSCSGLQRGTEYDPACVNLFVVDQVPVTGRPGQFQSYTSWPAPRVVLVAEQVAWHSPDKQMALAVAVGLGLKATAKSPLDRLLSSRTPGLRLSSEQIDAARAALSRTDSPKGEPVSLPVNDRGAEARSLTRVPLSLRVSSTCSTSPDQIRLNIESLSFWHEHGLQPEWLSCQALQQVPDEALQEACPQPGSGRLPMNLALLRLPGHHLMAINLLVVPSLPAGRWVAFPITRFLLVDENSIGEGLLEILGPEEPKQALRRLIPGLA